MNYAIFVYRVVGKYLAYAPVMMFRARVRFSPDKLVIY